MAKIAWRGAMPITSPRLLSCLITSRESNHASAPAPAIAGMPSERVGLPSALRRLERVSQYMLPAL